MKRTKLIFGFCMGFAVTVLLATVLFEHMMLVLPLAVVVGVVLAFIFARYSHREPRVVFSLLALLLCCGVSLGYSIFRSQHLENERLAIARSESIVLEDAQLTSTEYVPGDGFDNEPRVRMRYNTSKDFSSILSQSIEKLELRGWHKEYQYPESAWLQYREDGRHWGLTIIEDSKQDDLTNFSLVFGFY